MSVFLSVYHLSAWAGVCPGSHESAGRQKSGRARKGNVHLRTMLVGAAISAAKTKGSYLKDKFHRLKARRGALRAALAIAHKILVSAYHMLFTRLALSRFGEAYLDQIGQTRTVANLKRRTTEPKYRTVPCMGSAFEVGDGSGLADLVEIGFAEIAIGQVLEKSM